MLVPEEINRTLAITSVLDAGWSCSYTNKNAGLLFTVFDVNVNANDALLSHTNARHRYTSGLVLQNN